MRTPAKIMAQIADLLEKGDIKKFNKYMDKLSREEMEKCFRYSQGVQAIMLDGLARLEMEKPFIYIPEKGETIQ